VPTLQVQSPEFKSQSHQKGKKKKKERKEILKGKFYSNTEIISGKLFELY
jgi:hypothetical protein